MTTFGKMLRKIRIDHEELLFHMAKKLGVSPAFLSSVETGKKSVPNGWVGTITTEYALTLAEANELRKAADETVKQIRIDLTNVNGTQRDFAVAFARRFSEIPEETFKKLAAALDKDE